MRLGATKAALVVVGLALAAMGLSAAGDRGVGRLVRLRAEVARTEALNADLEAENAALVREIRALKEDDRVLEAVAREELGLVRPGEVVFRFEPGPGDGAP